MGGSLKHTVGFDDGPFPPGYRGDVDLVGAVFSGLRLEGVLRTRVRRDGVNATDRIAAAVGRSRFGAQLQLVLLQGIAVAGFNVVDIHALHRRLAIPVLVVSRREPDLAAIRRALLASVPGGERKWRLIERAGPSRPLEGLWVQCAGCTLDEVRQTIRALAVHGRVPEPLRTAHLIAGGVSDLATRQRV
jgi:endonuclease V-like protein UPF0215 family